MNFRSDTHLRHTSTSTSNYNSTSDAPSYLRGYDHEHSLVRPADVLEENEGGNNARVDSDSDTEGSEGRSLELASSHSSDEEESSSKAQKVKHYNGMAFYILSFYIFLFLYTYRGLLFLLKS